jgi:hypothetical protein
VGGSEKARGTLKMVICPVPTTDTKQSQAVEKHPPRALAPYHARPDHYG